MTFVAPRGGGLSDSANIQSAVNAFGTGGGEVTFDGTYTISVPIELPSGNTATMSFSGSGKSTTHFDLTHVTPRLFVWNRRSETTQTYKKYLFEDFTVDAKDATGVDSEWSVFGFDIVDSGDDYWGCGPHLSLENITIQNIDMIGLTTATAHNCIAIHPHSTEWVADQAATHVDDITITNCNIQGGMRGINVVTYGPDPCNSTLDRITVSDCYHDTLADPTVFWYSTNYHFGQDGRLGELTVTNCEGHRAWDCNMEVDQASEGLVEDCYMVDATYAGYYHTYFHNSLRGTGSLVYRNCTKRSTEDFLDEGYGNPGWGFDNAGFNLGSVEIVGCVYINDIPCVNANRRLAVHLNDLDVYHMDSFVIDGLTVHTAEPDQQTDEQYIRVVTASDVLHSRYMGVRVNGRVVYSDRYYRGMGVGRKVNG